MKLARFGDIRSDKNSLRHDANVLAITGIEADYDREAMPFDEARGRLERQGIAAILYTSPSHTDATPRWRVLCPLSEEMRPERRRGMLGRLNGLFGGIFSRESWALSQSYYFGSVNGSTAHRVALIDGLALDAHDDLDTIWTGPSNTEGNAEADRPGDEREIAELVRRILTGEELHTTLCPLAARLIGRNVPTSTAAEILRGIMLAYPEPARDDRWRKRFAEIDRLVQSACAKYAAPAADRRKNGRALAALTGRLLRAHRVGEEVRNLVLAEAAQRGVAADQAENIINWVAERELDRRRQNRARR